MATPAPERHTSRWRVVVTSRRAAGPESIDPVCGEPISPVQHRRTDDARASHRMRPRPQPRSYAHAPRDWSEPAAFPAMNGIPDRFRAQALAMAFLDGDWSRDGLTRRGALVVGHARPSLRSLVRSVLRGYPRPPWDRPRELAVWLSTRTAFETLRSEPWAEVTPDAGRWLPFQPAMGAMPWRVPAIPTSGELAHLLDLSLGELAWFADVKSLEKRAADERLRNYRYRWISKANGRLRLVEAPKTRLRECQRLLLRTILDRIPAHPATHGFVAGRSPLTFVEPHQGADV